MNRGMNRVMKNTNSLSLVSSQIRDHYYRLALVNYSRGRSLEMDGDDNYLRNEKMSLNEIYYRIVDRRSAFTTRTRNGLRSFMEDALVILCERGFVGVFPGLEDEVINAHWNSLAASPDSGTGDAEPPQHLMNGSGRKTFADWLDRTFTYVMFAQGEELLYHPRNLLKSMALYVEFSAYVVDQWLPS